MITVPDRHRRTDRQTDRRTTYDGNTALCTKVHRAVINSATVIAVGISFHSCILTYSNIFHSFCQPSVAFCHYILWVHAVIVICDYSIRDFELFDIFNSTALRSDRHGWSSLYDNGICKWRYSCFYSTATVVLCDPPAMSQRYILRPSIVHCQLQL